MAQEEDQERRSDLGSDLDPGAHADFYKGGDFPRDRIGPEGGFEERADFRRSERHADQGQSSPDEAPPEGESEPR